MEQLTIYLDDARVGTGLYTVLVVRTGRKVAYCLHAPTLTQLQLPVDRLRGATQVPIRRGFKAYLTDKRRQFRGYNYRLPESLIKEAIESL